jgi:hypothetical protein
LVKGVVDFNRVEMLGIIAQEAFLGKVLRIKRTFPVIVLPTRSADMNVPPLCCKGTKEDFAVASTSEVYHLLVAPMATKVLRLWFYLFTGQ